MKATKNTNAKAIERILAFLFDIICTIALILAFICLYACLFKTSSRAKVIAGLILSNLLLCFPLIPIVTTISRVLFQESPGKLMFGLQVLRKNNTPVKTWQIILREFLMKGLLYYGSLFFLIDIVLLFANKGKTLHDLVSKTQVIKKYHNKNAYKYFVMIFLLNILLFVVIIGRVGQVDYAIQNHYNYSIILQEEKISVDNLWEAIEITETNDKEKFIVEYEVNGRQFSDEIHLEKIFNIWWIVIEVDNA